MSAASLLPSPLYSIYMQAYAYQEAMVRSIPSPVASHSNKHALARTVSDAQDTGAHTQTPHLDPVASSALTAQARTCKTSEKKCVCAR